MWKRLFGSAPPGVDVRDSAAGKIHEWRPPFRKMSAGDPFTAKDMQPLYDAEVAAVGHHHRFTPVPVLSGPTWRCECGIAYRKHPYKGWRTHYFPLQAERNFRK